MTTERIVEIAKNILEHSETDIELGSLCAEINRAAYTFFIEEKGNTMNKNLKSVLWIVTVVCILTETKMLPSTFETKGYVCLVK